MALLGCVNFGGKPFLHISYMYPHVYPRESFHEINVFIVFT